MSIFFVLAAIVLLGVMVLVHECGHFFAARLTGIPVKEFAIGFGPKLLAWKSKKHETQFFLRLIPAGGYCMFYGEDEVSGIEAGDPRNIGNHPVWKRMVTIAMGPVMNFVLALVAAVVLYGIVGEDVGGTYGHAVVQQVEAGSPAEQAGIQANDRILTVNGQEAVGLTEDGNMAVEPLISAYQAGDAPLMLTLLRDGETITASLAPFYDEALNRYRVGVSLVLEYTPRFAPVSFFRAMRLGADYCVRAGGAILSGLRALVTTGEGFSESAGPVGIVKMIAEETQRSGWTTYIQLLVMISVNLGLFNLIPIPGLDGSRIVFLVIEAIRRKPVPQKVEAYVHMAGYLMLIGLMLVMTYKDILSIFR